jgi:hypothetical protein
MTKNGLNFPKPNVPSIYLKHISGKSLEHEHELVDM